MASHGHAESLALREQFDTAEQQKDASTLGMWIFLITEVMFFGGMFLAYSVYRSAYPMVFALASSSLDVYLGAANTVVLLCSSLTMVLAVRASQDARTLTRAIRQELQNVDPDIPLANVRTLDAVVADSIAPRRLSVVLLSAFSGIALLFGMLGVTQLDAMIGRRPSVLLSYAI